jgi:hypothetical protein
MQQGTEMAERHYKRAIVKFNNANGALLCNACWRIVATGNKHEDVEHYCDECRGDSDAANNG